LIRQAETIWYEFILKTVIILYQAVSKPQIRFEGKARANEKAEHI